MDAYENAARVGSSHGNAPSHIDGVKDAYISILPSDPALLAQRIGQLRQHRALGCAELECTAGRLIERYPDCLRHASRLADWLTIARDLAVWEGRP